MPFYPNASKKQYKDFERICGYGDVTGILGANCRHSYSPVIEGVNEPAYTQADLEAMKAENNMVTYDDKEYDGYQATQMQRRLERTIRKQKRRVNAFKDAGLSEDADAAKARLTRLETKYSGFSKAAGLPEQIERKNISFVGEAARAEAQQLKAQRMVEAEAAALKNKENTAILRTKIESGEISTKIRPQVQARHIEGTAQFEQYKANRIAKGKTPQSILTVTTEEAQELVDKYHCTGEVVVKIRNDGSFEIKEYTDTDRVIGKEYTDNIYRETKRIGIFYSKKGTHIVPVQPKE